VVEKELLPELVPGKIFLRGKKILFFNGN